MKPLVFSYVRFSTDRQADGHSMKRQTDMAVKYAAEQGWTIDKRTFEDLGLSAFRGRNVREGALGAFLSAVDRKLIPSNSILLVESLDRVSRAEVMDALEVFTGIINRGITLVTIIDRQHYSRESIRQNWSQLIFSIASLARANNESETKAVRAREFVQNKLTKNIPLGHSMPPWISLDVAGTGYVINSEKADIVRRIFKMLLSGNGLYLICTTLNNEDVPVLRNARDGWSVSGLTQMIHNPNVIGHLKSKHGVFEDHYPAIIEKSVYYEALRLMTERKTSGRGRKGENVANLFSGLVKCGECGSSMKFSRSPNGSRSKVNMHLQCMSALEKRGCTAKRLSYREIEKSLLNRFLEDDAIEVEPRSITDIDPSVALRAEIEDKQSQVDKLLDMIEASGDRESKNLLNRLAFREAELSALQDRLRESEVPMPTADVWSAAQDAMRKHQELQESPGPELYALRLQLQAAIKQFVERIDLPMKIVVDKKNKIFGHVVMREALILYRGRQRMMMIKRDKERDGKSTKQITEAVLASHERKREPVSVLYRVPVNKGFIKNPS
jgi:DNA invertase Pin-like site-specific DNA recombinase